MSDITTQNVDDYAVAFGRQVKQLRPGLLLAAMRYTADGAEAEDAVQETLLRCWAARSRLDHIDHLPQFAMQTLHNYCIDLVRQKRQSVGPHDANAQSADRPDTAMMMREAEEWMAQCIDRLPAGMRTAIMMKGVDGLTYEQMAACLGTTEAAVRAKVAKARKKLYLLYSQRQ